MAALAGALATAMFLKRRAQPLASSLQRLDPKDGTYSTRDSYSSEYPLQELATGGERVELSTVRVEAKVGSEMF